MEAPTQCIQDMDAELSQDPVARRVVMNGARRVLGSARGSATGSALDAVLPPPGGNISMQALSDMHLSINATAYGIREAQSALIAVKEEAVDEEMEWAERSHQLNEDRCRGLLRDSFHQKMSAGREAVWKKFQDMRPLRSVAAAVLPAAKYLAKAAGAVPASEVRTTFGGPDPYSRTVRTTALSGFPARLPRRPCPLTGRWSRLLTRLFRTRRTWLACRSGKILVLLRR